jgi:hypothetical protein
MSRIGLKPWADFVAEVGGSTLSSWLGSQKMARATMMERGHARVRSCMAAQPDGAVPVYDLAQ